MTDLLQTPGSGPGDEPPVYRGWHVGEAWSAHSAAKFWPRLLDEALGSFPSCRAVELSAPGAGILTRGLLDPGRALERSLERLSPEDAKQALESAVTELELFGMPAGVRLRLLADEDTAPLHEQALDAVDEEILPNLLAWLLEWAGIDAALWNNEFVHGAFTAEDHARRLRYRLTFDLQNAFLSEDLYRRSIRVDFVVEPLA